MKLNSISGVTHYVEDLDESVAFYEALGFRMGKKDLGHAICYVNWFWVDLVATASEENTQRKQAASLPNKASGTLLHIKVEDVDELRQGLLEQGLKPESEPKNRPSGSREFVLSDPDGYRLAFFEK